MDMIDRGIYNHAYVLSHLEKIPPPPAHNPHPFIYIYSGCVMFTVGTNVGKM